MNTIDKQPCETCEGKGYLETGGMAMEDDLVEKETCFDCDGTGISQDEDNDLVAPIPDTTKQRIQNPPKGDTSDIDEIAYHVANSKAYKFYMETGKHLRDSIKVDYQRQAKAKLEQNLAQEANKARLDEAHISLSMNEGSQTAQLNRIAQLTKKGKDV